MTRDLYLGLHSNGEEIKHSWYKRVRLTQETETIEVLHTGTSTLPNISHYSAWDSEVGGTLLYKIATGWTCEFSPRDTFFCKVLAAFVEDKVSAGEE